MKTYDPSTIADHGAGRVDAIDGLTLVFDSGVVNLAIGIRGQFTWDDIQIGAQTFHGTGSLVSLDLPDSAMDSESRGVTASLFETYMVEGSDIAQNVFADGVRATIDDENWEGRTAILSVFWLNEAGVIVEREQVEIRQMDAMPLEWDEQGNPVRKLILEQQDIIQREIEGTTSNAEFQMLIDPTDKAFEHVGATKSQKINFGQRPANPVT